MCRFLPFAALLGVAFVLGCQDLAPVGPVDLEPQFVKRGVTCVGEDDHPSCPKDDDNEPPVDGIFTVKITGSAVSVPETQLVSGPGLLAQGIFVDLSAFPGCPNLALEKGQLFMPVGDDHVHFSFQFMHREKGPTTGAESQHTLAMLGEFTGGGFPPIGTPAVITQIAGEPWSITSKGKNHKNGCKAEGITDGITVGFTVIFAEAT